MSHLAKNMEANPKRQRKPYRKNNAGVQFYASPELRKLILAIVAVSGLSLRELMWQAVLGYAQMHYPKLYRQYQQAVDREKVAA